MTSGSLRGIFLSLLLLGACGGGPAVESGGVGMAETKIPRGSLRALAGKRILFGHQSVGRNLLDGIEDLRKEGEAEGIVLRPVDGGASAGSGGGILHVRVGRNRDPGSKISAFERAVEDAAPGGLDGAFFKFCYLDVSKESDPEGLFRTYRDRMSALERKFPRTRFFHVTVPLTRVRGDWKARLKRAIGRDDGEREANARRSAYNDLLRKEYGGRGTLFDLADLEATRPDGSRSTFLHDGRRVDMLASEYTEDLEHLDVRGRRTAARRLLSFLAERLP